VYRRSIDANDACETLYGDSVAWAPSLATPADDRSNVDEVPTLATLDHRD